MTNIYVYVNTHVCIFIIKIKVTWLTYRAHCNVYNLEVVSAKKKNKMERGH